MASGWYVSQHGEKSGPFTSSRLKELASSGRFSPDAQVANTPDGPWHPISKVKGLEVKISFPPPPPSKSHQNYETPTAPSAHREPARPTAPMPATAIESHVWSGRPSQVTNIKTFIFCGLFFWLVIPMFVALWRWLVVRCITYELTTQRFKISHGVLTRRTDELELYRVKDTAFSQNLFQRIFQLANVDMKTSDPSSPAVSLESISASQAKVLREQIRTLTEELRDRKRVREVDYV